MLFKRQYRETARNGIQYLNVSQTRVLSDNLSDTHSRPSLPEAPSRLHALIADTVLNECVNARQNDAHCSSVKHRMHKGFSCRTICHDQEMLETSSVDRAQPSIYILAKRCLRTHAKTHLSDVILGDVNQF